MEVDKLFKLEAEEELRVEVDCGKNDKVIVELKSGLAEIFGTELVINTKYVFSNDVTYRMSQSIELCCCHLPFEFGKPSTG